MVLQFLATWQPYIRTEITPLKMGGLLVGLLAYENSLVVGLRPTTTHYQTSLSGSDCVDLMGEHATMRFLSIETLSYILYLYFAIP
jgi:hypothetical protein